MYKLIALDMDGTTLNSEHLISDRTKHAIKKARENGVKVVLATGRPMAGIKKYLSELDMMEEGDFAITYNGALVQNTYSKEVVSKTCLKKNHLMELYKISKHLNINIHAFTKDGCITPKMSKYTELEGAINEIPVEVVKYEELDEDTDILKIMMIDEPEKLDKAINELPEELYSKYTIVQSAPYFLEFLDNRVNKGEGVKNLAQSLNISKEQVICIGDAGNDLHMIEYAGLGVAMGNAFDELKSCADYITKTNDEDGVAHVIEKFVLST
ncbi:sugar-phosphatase [Clostridium hydrogeniformans]|uniref:sugar-phosphatase n=1 Tax=Clostridium hydrogeniformans TaxID=349933 RepID=UPI000486C2FC|nr:sugar-phosphatase [Clostridium hydrogeniformans]